MLYVIDAHKVKRLDLRAVNHIEGLVREEQRALAAYVGACLAVGGRHRQARHKPREGLEHIALARAAQLFAADARARARVLAALHIAVSFVDKVLVLPDVILGALLEYYLHALAPLDGDAYPVLLHNKCQGVLRPHIGQAEAAFLVRHGISVLVGVIDLDLLDGLVVAVEYEAVEGDVTLTLARYDRPGHHEHQHKHQMSHKILHFHRFIL